jgi:hypothetical protein
MNALRFLPAAAAGLLAIIVSIPTLLVRAAPSPVLTTPVPAPTAPSPQETPCLFCYLTPSVTYQNPSPPACFGASGSVTPTLLTATDGVCAWFECQDLDCKYHLKIDVQATTACSTLDIQLNGSSIASCSNCVRLTWTHPGDPGGVLDCTVYQGPTNDEYKVFVNGTHVWTYRLTCDDCHP